MDGLRGPGHGEVPHRDRDARASQAVSNRFRRFIGISLGGGRGKNTAVARIEFSTGDDAQLDPTRLVVAEARARSADRGGGHIEGEAPGQPFRDDELVRWLDRYVDDETIVGIDAPLTLPACVRCQLECPGVSTCEVPVVAWMRQWAPKLSARSGRADSNKPFVTPYTQRATELLLSRVTGQPREALGQGMGPLSARATYLQRVFAGRLRLHENLLEVHPRATVWRLFGLARERATRLGDRDATHEARREVLQDLSEGFDFDRVWPELIVRRVHVFHAVIAAFSVLHASHLQLRGPQELDRESLPAEVRDAARALGSLWRDDGWVFTPHRREV